MKKTKRICAMILAIVIVLGMTPFVSAAKTYENLTYEYSSDSDSITITGYKSTVKGELVIPDHIDGKPVTSIGGYAFEYCTGLTSINIPASVTSIGDYAFYGCTGLISITVDKNNSRYHSSGNCLIETATKKLIKGCNTSVIPDDGSVTSISSSAFSGCTGLTSITIPASVTSIGSSAFSDCTGLTSITIPASVTSIGSSAFSDCSGLTSIIVDKNNSTYHSSGNCLIETATKKLIKGCNTSVIPDDGSVTEIGSSAFSGCTELTSITIPEGVTSIHSFAFFGCTGLTSITIPEGVTYIDWHTFQDCTGLTSITIPSSVTRIFDFAFLGCTGLTSITILEGVTSISSSAFSDCTGLTSIDLPASVTTIDSSVFSGCTGLTSITVDKNNSTYHSSGNCLIETATKKLIIGCNTSVIPDDGSVTSIGLSAFSGCKGLTNITIPEGVTSIGDYAFYGCTGLTSISIPESVTEIKDSSFKNSRALIVLCKQDSYARQYARENGFRTAANIVTEGTLIWVYDVKFGRASLTAIFGDISGNIVIPYMLDGYPVTEIGDGVFEICVGLTSVTVPKTVKEISSAAFKDCTGLTSIDLPASVTSIGSSAFSGCTGLTSIDIPASVASIGTDAFRGCTGLTSITVDKNNSTYHSSGNCLIKTATKKLIKGCNTSVIPDDGSVTEIGDYAFSGCTGLTSITIPECVTWIGWDAFYGCTGLTSITVDKNNSTYHSSGNCLIKTATKKLIKGCNTSVIPDDGSVTEIGSSAFSGCTDLQSLSIPNCVWVIRTDAFNGCENLTLYVDAGSYAQKYAKDMNFRYIVNGTEETEGIWTYIFNNGTVAISKVDKSVSGGIVIPSELGGCPVTSITDGAFAGCTELTGVTIPESVKKLGQSAFSGCTGLTSVSLPDSLTLIGSYAFFGCAELSEITIPSSVTSIGESAFFICDKLTINCVSGSYAETYARENNIPFVSSGVLVFGDVNGDGIVDISDAMLIFYHVAKKELLTDEQLLRCDTNDDNEVDIVDAMRVFYFVAKKIPSLKG